MSSTRRLPTSLLVLLAAAVVVAGGMWWVRSAPVSTTKATPTGDRVLLQLEDGATLTFATDSSTFDGADGRISALQQIITSDWPCRPDESDGLPPNMMDNQTIESFPPAGVQVVRLPRCSAQTRPGR
jgi:hypothetical protein